MALILYASPHQDDETLSMGASIRRHLEAGHQVHVLLVSSGINSGARASTGLSRPAFTEARDDEFMRACRRLGVRFSNILISRHSTEDGELEAQDAEDALRAYMANHGDAWVKTYSNLAAPGRHPDHIALGQAAVNVFTAGTITNLRLYVEPWLLDEFRSANSLPLSEDRASSTGVVQAALDEYGKRDAAAGMHGIGHASVADAFALVRANPVSYYHAPTAKAA